MSNVERDPSEIPCGGAATLVPERLLLEPRLVPLGGPRGLPVRRTLPHREIRTVGAWCFLDEYGPHDVRRDGPMDVPPHPHTGLQTVTWLLDGEVRHRDSLGSDRLVRPGELNLMTAGRGIAHSEESTLASPTLSGLQLWVALPDSARDRAPHFAHHADLPVVSVDGATVTVLVGAVDGARSTAAAYSPLVGADVALAPDTRVRLPLEEAFEHAVLAVRGQPVVDGRSVPAGSLLHLGRDRRDVVLEATGPARLMLLGGEPFEEELLMWWNFVGRDHDDIAAARADWEAGSDRFGPVGGYPGSRLPAPPLPGTRLLPRSRRRAPSPPPAVPPPRS